MSYPSESSLKPKSSRRPSPHRARVSAGSHRRAARRAPEPVKVSAAAPSASVGFAAGGPVDGPVVAADVDLTRTTNSGGTYSIFTDSSSDDSDDDDDDDAMNTNSEDENDNGGSARRHGAARRTEDVIMVSDESDTATDDEDDSDWVLPDADEDEDDDLTDDVEDEAVSLSAPLPVPGPPHLPPTQGAPCALQQFMVTYLYHVQDLEAMKPEGHQRVLGAIHGADVDGAVVPISNTDRALEWGTPLDGEGELRTQVVDAKGELALFDYIGTVTRSSFSNVKGHARKTCELDVEACRLLDVLALNSLLFRFSVAGTAHVFSPKASFTWPAPVNESKQRYKFQEFYDFVNCPPHVSVPRKADIRDLNPSDIVSVVFAIRKSRAIGHTYKTRLCIKRITRLAKVSQ
ncbi:hypothetical protein PsYK624_080210 [Phanerochaete sordida]|uniref:Uncharacterized protein n=1 Tax=Phanerochaete sordida TaxID=48140 RepID=A0A9P3LE36_9APHY|nr:hypothetical protein PsYK624_080210 [Phanerochaete sordida]